LTRLWSLIHLRFIKYIKSTESPWLAGHSRCVTESPWLTGHSRCVKEEKLPPKLISSLCWGFQMLEVPQRDARKIRAADIPMDWIFQITDDENAFHSDSDIHCLLLL
jgi:hypothetical protein